MLTPIIMWVALSELWPVSCLSYSPALPHTVHLLCGQQSNTGPAFTLFWIKYSFNVAQGHIRFVAATSHRSLMEFSFTETP